MSDREKLKVIATRITRDRLTIRRALGVIAAHEDELRSIVILSENEGRFDRHDDTLSLCNDLRRILSEYSHLKDTTP